MSITGVTSVANERIRAASASDADAVFALVDQLSATYDVDRNAFELAFRNAVEQKHDHVLLVAERAGSVVGYVLMTIARLMYTREDAAQIQELIVDTDARGSGVGSRLVYAVEDECRARGLSQLTVASSRAPGFYDRLDYRSTADFLKKVFSAD
ncbi:MAG: family N-acetyltransferase [Homoserinimonas sp.]|jgi:predicted N-acetyltransferase YhbS|nr:family N-acetyltransferase [Homoserinimonas sp.]